MNKQSLLEVLSDQRKSPQSAPFIKREVMDREEWKKPNKFIQIFSGIRRCGKSTVLQAIRRQQKEQDYYMNFDDERLVQFTLEDFQTLYEVFLEQFGEQKTFYFDEIQNIPGWERFVRRLYDAGCKIYITGSNAHLLSHELGTHLTGRYIQTEIFPFSFYEFLLYKNVSPNYPALASTEERIQYKVLFQEYFSKGGFPEYLQSDNNAYLNHLYESILYRDIITRYKLPSDRVIKGLSNYLASNLGVPISFNTLKDLFDAGSGTTIKEYISYFENSYLYFSLLPFHYSLKKQVYGQKKIYAVDTKLANEVGFRFQQDRGRFLENIVYMELRRHSKTIYYHKESTECDFLIKDGLHITCALQVTAEMPTPETKAREIKGLLEAMQTYHLTEGFLITEDEEGEETHTTANGEVKIYIIPIYKWLLKRPFLKNQ